MLYESPSPDSISGSAIIVGLNIIFISSENYTTGILANVYSSFWFVSHCRCTPIVNWCAMQTPKVTEYTTRQPLVTGSGICKISLLPVWQLCQSYVHSTKPSWPIFRATSIPGHCIWQLVIFEKISAAHLQSAPGFSLGRSHVSRKKPKILTRHGIPRLELCYSHLEIMT